MEGLFFYRFGKTRRWRNGIQTISGFSAATSATTSPTKSSREPSAGTRPSRGPRSSETKRPTRRKASGSSVSKIRRTSPGPWRSWTGSTSAVGRSSCGSPTGGTGTSRSCGRSRRRSSRWDTSGSGARWAKATKFCQVLCYSFFN